MLSQTVTRHWVYRHGHSGMTPQRFLGHDQLQALAEMVEYLDGYDIQLNVGSEYGMMVVADARGQWRVCGAGLVNHGQQRFWRDCDGEA